MSNAVDRRACRAANLFLAVALLIAALVPRALSVTPDGDGLEWRGRRLPNVCLERHLTGQPCDTCRLGRAVVLASQGRWGDSLAQHRGGLVVWLWVAVQALWRVALAWAAPRRRWRRLDAGLSGGSLVLVWVAVRFWIR